MSTYGIFDGIKIEKQQGAENSWAVCARLISVRSFPGFKILLVVYSNLPVIWPTVTIYSVDA